MPMTKELPDILAIGIQAEIEANELYSKLAEQINNVFLKDRLESLASDEKRHRKILEKIFEENFPGKPVILPDGSGVPKPNILISEENKVSDILLSAMETEKQAEVYYINLAEQFKEKEKKELLLYLAKIEAGHHYFLKLEQETALRKENAGIE